MTASRQDGYYDAVTAIREYAEDLC